MTMHKHDNQVALDAYSAALAYVMADVRLDVGTTTQIKLWGIPGTSGRISVAGEPVDCTTALTCAKTANLITSTGADASAAMSDNTFYYGYVSNSLASYAPSSLRFSSTAPSAVTGYLGTSGNALNWRYVGDVYLSGDGYFYDNATARLCRSEFNKVNKAVTAYNSTATWSLSGTTTWRTLNNGTGNVCGYFLGDGKTHINVVATMAVNPVDGSCVYQLGFGFNTTSAPTEMLAQAGGDSSTDLYVTLSCNGAVGPVAKGLNYLTMLEAGVGTVIVISTTKAYGVLSTLVPF